MRYNEVQVKDANLSLHKATRSALFALTPGGIWVPINQGGAGGLQVEILSLPTGLTQDVNIVSSVALDVNLLSGIQQYADGAGSVYPATGIMAMCYNGDGSNAQAIAGNLNGALNIGYREYTTHTDWLIYGSMTLPYTSTAFSAIQSLSISKFARLIIRLRFSATGNGTLHAQILGSENNTNYAPVLEINGGIDFDPSGGIDIYEEMKPFRYIKLFVEQATGNSTSPNRAAGVTAYT